MNRFYISLCLTLGLLIFSGGEVAGQVLGHGGVGYSSYSGSNVSGGGSSHTITNPDGLTHGDIIRILTEAAPHFNVSFDVIYQAWRRGHVEIIKIRPGIYKVVYGGGEVILTIEFGIF